MGSNIGLGVLGAGLGAGLMFLMDPQLGRRRRALLRDKAVSYSRQTRAAVDKTRRDIRNRTYGTVVSIKSGHVRNVRPSILNANWPPATRLAVGVAGCAMAVTGLAKGGLLGSIIGAIGIGSIGVAVTNASLRNTLSHSASAPEARIRSAA